MNHIKTQITNLYYEYKKGLLLVGILIFCSIAIFPLYGIYNAIKPSAEKLSDTSYEDCNTMGIELRGDLYTYVPLDKDGNKLEGYEDTSTSEDALFLISEAEYYDNIKAILVEVDSYGGSPAAAEEIAGALKITKKPVVAFIRGAGTSAAYYAVTSADYIFALKNSDVGSIGVTQSYLDNVSKNQQEGYSFVQLSAGKFKDSGSPDKPITQEERDLFMRDLKIVHENFIQTVSENRKIALEKVRIIADGSIVLGEKAKELGLIDEIGNYDDAVLYLGDLVGEDVSVCW